MWAFALIRKTAGYPDLPSAAIGLVNYCLPYDDNIPAIFGNWRVYCLAAHPVVLQVLNTEPGIIVLCAATYGENNIWFPEAKETLGQAEIDKINAWLTAHEKPIIPNNWTKEQIVNKIMTHISQIDSYHASDWVCDRD